MLKSQVIMVIKELSEKLLMNQKTAAGIIC